MAGAEGMLGGMLRKVKCGQCQWLYFFYYNREGREGRSTMSKKKPTGREVEVSDRGENILMAYGTLVLKAQYTLAFHMA